MTGSGLTEQEQQLRRVASNIAHIVYSFCVVRLHTGTPRFHMDDLVLWVQQYGAAAPDSPSRILRYLRAQKRVDYVVLSRSDSYYEVVAVYTRKETP